MRRSKPSISASGADGVYQREDRGGWHTRVAFEGRNIYLGVFDTIDLASIAVNAGVKVRDTIMTRREEAGLPVGPKEKPKPPTLREKLKKSLMPQAEQGNLRAIAALLELDREEAAPNAFNVQVNIAKYTIDDTSLTEIMAKAYTPHVIEALGGLRMRMEHDEFPHETRDLLECFCRQYEEHADRIYAPTNE